MVKNKNLIKLIISFLILAIIMGSNVMPIGVKAEETIQYDDIVYNDINERGLGATIELGLDGENGIITADAYNRITWGFSTIRVYVYLYSSTIYQESYEDMWLEGMAYDDDLNIFETLAYSTSTKGATKYWKARMRFMYNNAPWVEVSTKTLHYDGNANVID